MSSNTLEIGKSPELGEEVPLDYRALVGGDPRVILFGEEHYQQGAFFDIAHNAQRLREAGVGAYLLEAPAKQDFRAVNDGDFSGLPELNLGPTPSLESELSRDRGLSGKFLDGLKTEIETNGDRIAESRQKLVMELVKAGIPVFPIDDWQHITDHRNRETMDDMAVAIANREDVLSGNIRAMEEEYGKVVVQIGRSHTRRGVGHLLNRPDLIHRETGQRLVELDIPFRTVIFETFRPTTIDPGSGHPSGSELDRFMVRADPAEDYYSAEWYAGVPMGEQESRIRKIQNP